MLRAKVVKERGPLPAHSKFAQSIKQFHNPYNESHETRIDWLPKNIELNKNAKIVAGREIIIEKFIIS